MTQTIEQFTPFYWRKKLSKTSINPPMGMMVMWLGSLFILFLYCIPTMSLHCTDLSHRFFTTFSPHLTIIMMGLVDFSTYLQLPLSIKLSLGLIISPFCTLGGNLDKFLNRLLKHFIVVEPTRYLNTLSTTIFYKFIFEWIFIQNKLKNKNNLWKCQGQVYILLLFCYSALFLFS